MGKSFILELILALIYICIFYYLGFSTGAYEVMESIYPFKENKKLYCFISLYYTYLNMYIMTRKKLPMEIKSSYREYLSPNRFCYIFFPVYCSHKGEKLNVIMDTVLHNCKKEDQQK